MGRAAKRKARESEETEGTPAGLGGFGAESASLLRNKGECRKTLSEAGGVADRVDALGLPSSQA